MKVKALIVDDEYPARQELRHLLQRTDEVEVVGEATSVNEALTLIKAMDYGLVFCDIQLPGASGLDLARQLAQMESPPSLVFTTAYPEYAVQAFEVDAVDYLLKPIAPGRLRQAIQKALRQKEQNGKNGEGESAPPVTWQRLPQRLGRLPVEKQGKTLLIREEDIIYAYTKSDSVFIRTPDERYSSRFTLKELEERLQEPPFFRVHRCYIVNLTKVQEIIPFFNGTFTLTVYDGQRTEIPVSRNQAKKLKLLLGL
ncbi:MAG: response regulator transcription factor, partial [Clostridia bacterium]|nr:response regulator transcription factor [Clostridia bacterium]